MGHCSQCAFDGLNYSCRISDVIKYFVVLCLSQRKSFLYSRGYITYLILPSPIVSRMDLDLGRISCNGHGQWRRIRRVHLYSLQQLRDWGCIWTDGCHPEGQCTLPNVTGRELNIIRVAVSFLKVLLGTLKMRRRMCLHLLCMCFN